MKKILDKNTQEFIFRMKRETCAAYESASKVLVDMTYGYYDEKSDTHVVDVDSLVKMFFVDYMSCCDSPGAAAHELISAVQEGTSIVNTMIEIMRYCRVCNGMCYCNGFSEAYETFKDE